MLAEINDQVIWNVILWLVVVVTTFSTIGILAFEKTESKKNTKVIRSMRD